ncbi:MAG: DEAD/DEAH box helicase family protein [Candidatus Omnitrophica bacterium]|nr:DEAD/DEAH box helicase family protein [Candidatus Omnitrophota bacterium]MBU4478409.1 DEAD/DEAH box helicase family protein [Candidatus Omnitrophota bacterium]
MFEGPEKKFQRHVGNYFLKKHHFALLEETDITDRTYYIAEEHLIGFLRKTQPETFKKLEENYGVDASLEILRALRGELEKAPLWYLIRHGLPVRGLTFRLFYPKPRSSESEAGKYYPENRISFRPELVIKADKRPDFVLFLNGLPILVMELKHEKNQTVHDAVNQFVTRDHSDKIFQLPFLYIAADTSDVMVATDSRREENFRWHNAGLENKAETEGEYPIEYLYRDAFSKDAILEYLSFYLIYVCPEKREDQEAAKAPFTVFPRFHQSRMVGKLSGDILAHFDRVNDVGKKYLIDHSAGSGKTLSICWLADRLHSLYHPATDKKMLNMIFVLTDRKSLNKNIKDEFEKFSHLRSVVGITEDSADLKGFLDKEKQIVVTTLQKFAWILDEIKNNERLKTLQVGFLIDEAHRSQEGKLGTAIRLPFRDGPDADEEAADPEDEIARVIKANDRNQLFVAFTATPSEATIQLFGKSFDGYAEAEAIQEGYIVDVARSVISFKTLYNLHCSYVPAYEEEQKLFPAGIVSKALKNVAFQDEGLIQYKAEVMIRTFEKSIKDLIGGKAKAMIVTSSRMAGLIYHKIIKDKLRDRGSDYKVLYAFSDFVHPQTNELITEFSLNELGAGEDIEDRFKQDAYRLMIVANKFQEGFDEPLLAGMFLDKPVFDRKAVQTVSRLNRACEGKDEVVVVDFTNNAKEIVKAFKKYRQGTPFDPDEPDKETCVRLYAEIMAKKIFTQDDAKQVVSLVAGGNDPQAQSIVSALRVRFQDRIKDFEQRKAFVYLLAKFAKSFYFLHCFFSYPEDLAVFAAFADYIGPQLIKEGKVSELMKRIKQTQVVKASVQFEGIVRISGAKKVITRKGKKAPVPQKKVTIEDVINSLKEKFKISDSEAIIIREVMEEKTKDENIRQTVMTNRLDRYFLEHEYPKQVNHSIQDSYETRGRYEELGDPKYTDPGAIFATMSLSVIYHDLETAV